MVVLVTGWLGCATTHHAEAVAPPSEPAGVEGEAMGGGEASGPEHEPEVVHTGKQLRLGLAEAEARYHKGARCGGEDAPDAVIGAPDRRNEMQVARDRVVTYGFRFPAGTLLIRCRADHVEVTRALR
jgi:hypothetical protein